MKVIPSVIFASLLVTLFASVTWHKKSKETRDQASSECASLFENSYSEFKPNYISVPLDWDRPNGEKIKIMYMTNLKADWRSKNIMPVMFFNGGPGRPGYDGAETVFSNYKDWIQAFPNQSKTLAFIFMDQRGTGCSGLAPSGHSPSEVKRLTHFGTRSIVNDAEAIRKRLIQDSTWKIYGESFGGKIVYRYIEQHPKSINSAHVFGFAQDSVNRDKIRILKTREMYNEYFKKYPEDKARLKSLVLSVSDNNCIDTDMGKICGREILDLFGVSYLPYTTVRWEYLHEWLYHSDSVMNTSILVDYLQALVDANIGFFNSGALREVVNLYELPKYYDYRSACKDIDNFIDKPDRWLPLGCDFTKAVSKYETTYIESDIKQDPISYKRIAENLSGSNFKLYVYAGGKDALMPSEIIKSDIGEFGSNAIYREFTNLSHDGYVSDNQIWSDLTNAAKSQ